MFVILCIAVVVLAATYLHARRRARNPIARAFGGREFRRFDAHLEGVAREELRLIEQNLARYLAGRAGHVVVVSKAPQGVALELSDGRRLALRGISSRTVQMLNSRAPIDMLRPASLHRDAFSYRLLLRGAAGTETKIYARNIALAS
ncbi:MAG: hypothetical protein QOF92_2424 [Pseudonocardiales bacterium]|jgi:hypothetical protein|nr:hypothetical protein [Pseudonocardiales bacterium]MDT4929557.1 hypothetical protein [Pseudonocardiales bacterium]MDT4949209.1 hypothetical protein [Pseudonocardiales bacterium]